MAKVKGNRVISIAEYMMAYARKKQVSIVWAFDRWEKTLTIEAIRGNLYVDKVYEKDELPPSNFDLMMEVHKCVEALIAKEGRQDI